MPERQFTEGGMEIINGIVRMTREKDRLICGICVEWVSHDDLYVDADGQKWDICKPCQQLAARVQAP